MIEKLPIQDIQAAEVLMYRDAHFAGSFQEMLTYFRKQGRGATPNFTLEEIEKLAAYEEEAGENVAPLILTGVDAERVSKARDAYKKLREIYEEEGQKSKAPELLADLILTEDESAAKEIEAICNHGPGIIPFLIDLLRSPDFYDPLFPGYGQTPELTAICLGKIGDKKAIISLFETLDAGDFSHEEATLRALKTLGTPAKEFLLQVLHAKPITFDNERAAVALIAFKEEPDVSKKALALLLKPEFYNELPLNTYLALICEGLKDQNEREQFQALAEDPNIPKMLAKDMRAVIKEWNSSLFI